MGSEKGLGHSVLLNYLYKFLTDFQSLSSAVSQSKPDRLEGMPVKRYWWFVARDIATTIVTPRVSNESETWRLQLAQRLF